MVATAIELKDLFSFYIYHLVYKKMARLWSHGHFDFWFLTTWFPSFNLCISILDSIWQNYKDHKINPDEAALLSLGLSWDHNQGPMTSLWELVGNLDPRFVTCMSRLQSKIQIQSCWREGSNFLYFWMKLRFQICK